MSRLAPVLMLILVSCGGPASATASPSAMTARSPVPLPSPSLHPHYPPVDLADVVALSSTGVARRFLGAEGQNLGPCSRGWERIYEPDGTNSQQTAADLVAFAMSRQLLTKSCGGMVFGTTNDAHCNCYHGDHGYLEIDRGPGQEPVPGKMQVLFEVVENEVSPGDWEITVDAPG